MTDDRKAKVLESLRLIREDCKSDAAAWDGLPFTGLNVGSQFGGLYAMVAALARTVSELVEASDVETVSNCDGGCR